MTCPAYRPDHNGECLNCDEPADAHTWVQPAYEVTGRRWRVHCGCGFVSEPYRRPQDADAAAAQHVAEAHGSRLVDGPTLS